MKSGSEILKRRMGASSWMRTVLGWPNARSRWRDCASRSATCARSTGSTCARRRGRFSGCWGRMEPERPRRCGFSPRCCLPTAAARGWLGSTWCRDAAALRAQIGLAGQYAAVDENLTGFENLEMVGRLYHLGEGTIARARARAARALLAHRRGRPPREDLLGRHAPPARPGRRARGAPARAVPRRAHDRARSGQPAAALGDDRGARGGRDHRPAHHPVPRRGGPARRPHRRDRPRPRDSRGHAGRAEEPVGGERLEVDARGLRPGGGGDRGAGSAGRRATEVRARDPA